MDARDPRKVRLPPWMRAILEKGKTAAGRDAFGCSEESVAGAAPTKAGQGTERPRTGVGHHAAARCDT